MYYLFCCCRIKQVVGSMVTTIHIHDCVIVPVHTVLYVQLNYLPVGCPLIASTSLCVAFIEIWARPGKCSSLAGPSGSQRLFNLVFLKIPPGTMDDWSVESEDPQGKERE